MPPPLELDSNYDAALESGAKEVNNDPGNASGEQDREIQAMAAISRALQGLDDDAIGRVVEWATNRYGSERQAVERSGKQGRHEFSDVASIYDAANPRSDAEKVLVIGYWKQVVESDSDLDAQQINKELKQLGHGVSNITTAFRSLIQRTPRLALQVRKSGSTRQARKRYRLTTEGIRRVEEMTGNR